MPWRHLFFSSRTHLHEERRRDGADCRGYGVIRMDCSDQTLQEIPKRCQKNKRNKKTLKWKKAKPKIHSCVCMSVSETCHLIHRGVCGFLLLFWLLPVLNLISFAVVGPVRSVYCNIHIWYILDVRSGAHQTRSRCFPFRDEFFSLFLRHSAFSHLSFSVPSPQKSFVREIW